LERIEARLGARLSGALEARAENTNVHVEPARFLSNVCRTSPARAEKCDQPMAEALLAGLNSDDLYVATALAEGDDAAWRVFEQRYSAAIRRICRQFGVLRADEDWVAADVHFDLLVHGGLARFCATGPLDVWMRRVIRIAALRARTERYKKRPCVRSNDLDWTRDPARVVAARQEHRRVRRAMRALPRDERRAIQLRFFRDKTLAVIADELGCRYPMQCSRILTRGVARMRQLLDRQMLAAKQE
jgi:RNA polymerase sigma factor (sigma-70 family)